MDQSQLSALLDGVARGSVPAATAAKHIGAATADLSFARIDLHRDLRCGFPEVVLCEGKTTLECVAIAEALRAASPRALFTRVNLEQAAALLQVLVGAEHHERARLVRWDKDPRPKLGLVSVCAAGTSDLPVAEEAALTAEAMGARVERWFDVGVAGLHRLEPCLPGLRVSSAIVVVAGMEGALPSVVGGLVDRPVIAVPTSTGYGTAFGGVTALLAMLNSCAAGVTVTNIDNGFGGGCAAAKINRLVVEGVRP
ncbi:MAG: nickel pincer cofactor biosynthesis protein LarB [Planctomycetes bacterium]|nr:nickel pincer cofactor biosynthesis protein LarB [Planctomycetota bacterium]